MYLRVPAVSGDNQGLRNQKSSRAIEDHSLQQKYRIIDIDHHAGSDCRTEFAAKSASDINFGRNTQTLPRQRVANQP